MSELVIKNISKTFGKKKALNNVSFKVSKGEIFGLIGPNGAGKSTLINILSTLSLPTEGEVCVSNLDAIFEVNKVRNKIGIVFQQTTLNSTGTAWENLRVSGKISNMSNSKILERGEYLLKEFGLMKVSNNLVSTYSGGMKRKLDIATSLLHSPDILLLDEPTTGLDPESRTTLWNIISRISRNENTTVLVTTHYLEELDNIATRVALINDGEIFDIGTPDELTHKLAADQIEINFSQLNPSIVREVSEYISTLVEVKYHQITSTNLVLVTSSGKQIISIILQFLIQKNTEIKFSELKQASLNDVYIANFTKGEKYE